MIRAIDHNEWSCDFCGRPNQRIEETCKSCGAVRPFIYGIPKQDVKPSDIVINITYTDLEVEAIGNKIAKFIHEKCKEKKI